MASGRSQKEKTVVLIADDEANLLLLLKDNLEEHGFQVITATNGEEALQRCMEHKPNVVILDVEMPKLNGWRVCEKITQNTEKNEMPVILILSAYAQPEDIKRGLRLGAKKYMTKPFKMKELVEAIASLSKKS